MGNEFMNLRKAEVAKVAPNRAALIGKFNQSMSSGNMGDMKEIQEADKRCLCILFGIPYEAEYQGEGNGCKINFYFTTKKGRFTTLESDAACFFRYKE